jgi:type IV secretory pathway protease TraF
MAPLLRSGDLVIVQEAPPSLLRRGDVVAVRARALGGTAIVKRLAGLPCERVEIGERRWRLGPSDYLVLGDHAADSLDSRTFGPITRHELIGRVRLRVWPFLRLRA